MELYIGRESMTAPGKRMHIISTAIEKWLGHGTTQWTGIHDKAYRLYIMTTPLTDGTMYTASGGQI